VAKLEVLQQRIRIVKDLFRNKEVGAQITGLGHHALHTVRKVQIVIRPTHDNELSLQVKRALLCM
jgi:hypothetical protein